MSVDFPTFERPAKQTSGRSAGGRPSIRDDAFQELGPHRRKACARPLPSRRRALRRGGRAGRSWACHLVNQRPRGRRGGQSRRLRNPVRPRASSSAASVAASRRPVSGFASVARQRPMGSITSNSAAPMRRRLPTRSNSSQGASPSIQRFPRNRRGVEILPQLLPERAERGEVQHRNGGEIGVRHAHLGRAESALRAACGRRDRSGGASRTTTVLRPRCRA